MGLKNRVWGLCFVVGFLVIGLVLPSLVGAAALPLPLRPTPEPEAVVVVEEKSATAIVLSVDLTSGKLEEDADPKQVWTVVQWQDALGGWHDVTGWRGVLDKVGSGKGEKTWGVLRRDLGRGPFRWLVYAEEGGDLIAESAPFSLPTHSGQVVTVSVK